MNPLVMFWNLQKAAVKTFARFSIEILVVFNFQEVALKPFAHIYIEILRVLEASGGCRESIIDVFGIDRRLL